MAGPLHDAEALSAWQGGESRLLYARHRADLEAPLYYLQDGTAGDPAIRAFTREHLQCPVPTCPDPYLKAVNRYPRKRDGFSHRPGAGGHAPESIHHLQGKALIERWIRQKYPEVRVEPEAATPSRARRADVLLTWPSGQQIAVEIQYAALTVGQWMERHASYREQGIVDVWLLGHTRPHLRPARRRSWEPEGAADGRVALTALHHKILSTGGPLLWLHPEREEVGLAWHEETPGTYSRHDEEDADAALLLPVPPREGNVLTDDRAFWTARSVDECALTPDGLTLPHLQALARNRQRLDAITADRKRRHDARVAAAEAEKARKAEAERKRQEEQAQREAANRERQERFSAWFIAQQPRWKDEWLTSPLRMKVLKRYQEIPAILTHSGPLQYGVLAHPEHWRAVVYGDLVLGREPGSDWTVGDAYRCVCNAGIRLHPHNKIAVSQAFTSFLKVLSRAGVIGLTALPRSSRIDSIRVFGPLESIWALREAERLEREQYQAQLRRARLARENVGRAPVLVPDYGPRFATGGFTCRKCGYRLADNLAASGLHIGCRPQSAASR